MEDARFHRNGLLSQLRSRQYGVFVHTAEWMTDLFVATPDFGNRGGTPHRLDAVLLTTHEPRDIWRNTYSTIAMVNNFIARIEEVETMSEADEAQIARFLAEAHYIRAYMYYILVKYFGMGYGPETTNSLAVPIVTTFDPVGNANVPRNTLREVYDFIMADIALAENLDVAGPTTEAERQTITIDAVKALKSRVQLMMRDYAGAAATAMELINSGRHPLTTSAADLRANWAEDTGSEDIFRMFVSGVESGSFLGGSGALQNIEASMMPFMNWNAGHNAHWPDWLPSQRVMDLYEADDFRRTAFFHRGDTVNRPDGLNGRLFVNFTHVMGPYMLDKWPWTTMYGAASHRHMPKVHRIAEQYLIAAEALYRTNRASEGLAVLNELRDARGASALPALTDEAIRNEWAKEMIGEGVYLAHMKRWGIGFNGRVQQVATNVATGDAVNTAFPPAVAVVAPPNWYRFTLPVPPNELNLNPRMVQTPEWVDPK
jgi:hypothetical protein